MVHICSPSVCEAVQEDWELEVSTGFIVKYLKKRCKLIWFYNLVLCYVRSNVMSDLIKYGVILTKNRQTDKNQNVSSCRFPLNIAENKVACVVKAHSLLHQTGVLWWREFVGFGVAEFDTVSCHLRQW